MKVLVLITSCFLLTACHDGSSSHHQSYVISKSHQTTSEIKAVEDIPKQPEESVSAGVGQPQNL